jgi:hypothetical protein
MANPFNKYLPEGSDIEEKKIDNPFLKYLPADEQSTFKSSVTPEPSYNIDLLKDNPFAKYLPTEKEDYAGSTSLWDNLAFAFKLGFSDTYRGVKQMANIDAEALRADQKKLYELMQGDNGGAIAMAYFGGSIIDPAGWLIPVTKAKTLYQAAKYGFITSGIAGGLGYVDEESILDTRTKQALASAAGGMIISPAATALIRKLRGKKTPLGLPGTEDVSVKVKANAEMLKTKLQSEAGEQPRNVLARKKIEVAEPELLKDIPSDKATLLRGPRRWFAENVVKGYQEKFGRPAFNYLTKGEFGAEAGTGTVGGAIGYISAEDDAPISTKLGKAFIGAMIGGGVIRGTKLVKIKKTFGKGEAEQQEIQETLAEWLGRNFIDGYKLPSNFKLLKADAQGHANHIASRFANIATKIRDNLTADESRILFNMLEGDIRFTTAPKTLKNLNKEARDLITEIAQEYVDLGLITRETFERNKKIYLKRSYADFEDTRKFGEELRTRGATLTVTKDEYNKIYKKQKAYTTTSLKTDTNGIFKQVEGPKQLLKGHRGWELLGTSEKVFKKLKKDDEVTIRWEYTKPQRIGLGEIEDAAYAIAETGRAFSSTITQYRFYNNVSKQPYVYNSLREIATAERPNYMKMPTTVIQGTDKLRYGNLAGKYVPTEVYKNLVSASRYAEISSNSFYSGYRKLNSLWKVSKTAWNPTVHTNNVMSNFILHDLVDADYKYLKPAWEALTSHNKEILVKGKKVRKQSELVKLAEQFGVFDADFVNVELNNIKLASKFPYKFNDTLDPFNNSVNAATSVYKDLKSKNILTSLTDFYRFEDSVFRLSVFQDRIAKGMAPAEAALDARRAFIDYNIDAPAINWMRNTITPFLAYTYRIVPILAETAIVRPWKYAKWAALGYGLNKLGGLFGGGDEEAERAVMPERKEGRVFGLPFLPYRNIKLPSVQMQEDPEFKGPTYIDITRFVPGGDILDLGQPGIPGLPAPLQPSFGLAGDIILPGIIGYDLFRGEKLKGQTGIASEDLKIRTKAIYEKLMPNIPFLFPGYASKSIETAREGIESGFRPETTELAALFRSLGFKFETAEIDKLTAQKSLELSRTINGYQEQINSILSQYRRGLLNEKSAEEQVDKVTEKIRKLADRYDLKFDKASAADIKQPLTIGNIFSKPNE